jgi:hypothetical protein
VGKSVDTAVRSWYVILHAGSRFDSVVPQEARQWCEERKQARSRLCTSLSCREFACPRRSLMLEVVQELVGRIYDAVLEPDLWPSFLTDLADVLGGSSAVFLDQDVVQQHVDLLVTYRIDFI